MVATRRSSQRLQEKTTSAPSSPVTSNTSTPTRASGTRKVAGSASKKSPSTGSATKGKRSTTSAAEEQSGDAQQQYVSAAESTEEDERSNRDEVTKELFQVTETTQSQQQTVVITEQAVSEEKEVVETTTVTTTTEVVIVEEQQQQQIEDEATVDSQATEDEEDEEEVLLMVDSEGEDDADEQDDDVADEDDDDEEEEDISAYVMMAASGVNLSTTKPSASSSLQSKTSTSSRLVPDALDSGASQHATYFAFRGYKCADGATLMAEKRTLEEQATLKSQLQVAAQSTRQREEHQNKKSAGRKWFDMESEELTAEARRDFALLRMRNYLDPKKFYKTSDHHKKLPKHFQMGVVIEGAHEFKSARLTKKQRQQTFTDEIMADTGIQSYTKRVFGQIQASRSGQGKKKKMKPSKRSECDRSVIEPIMVRGERYRFHTATRSDASQVVGQSFEAFRHTESSCLYDTAREQLNGTVLSSDTRAMASKHEEKRDDGEEEEDEDEDDISGSDGEDESESDEEMSESESDGNSKGTKADKGGKPGGGATKAGSERALVNQPFDEALDLSESDSGSVSEGLDSPKKAAKQLKNLPFDEALELSGSVQDLESPQKAATAAVGRKESPLPASSDRTGSGSMAAATAKPSGPASAAGAKGTSSAPAAPGAGQEVKNNPFDEEVDLSDSGESVDTNGHPSPDRSSMKAKSAAAASAAAAATPKQAAAAPTPSATATPAATAHVRRDDKSQQKPAALEERKQPTPAAAKPTPMAQKTEPAKKAAPEPSSKKKHDSDSSSEESGSEEDEDDDEEEDEDEESQSASTAGPGASANAGAGAGGASSQSAIMANAGSYKESDFAHLKVSGEVRELFQYIGRFKSQEIELETRLKCFIPEYIPAVGDMDAFLKIPRPDGELDNLGLKMLDEPSLTQSDATVLDLQLRSTSKKKHGDIVVRSIENAEKAPKEIDRWVKSIADLHRTKPPPQVHYTKTMPDIESLMQVWPEEFEELLSKTALPGASMDMALEQYVRVICALLDIPVHKNVYESLHVLFTLYLEFRSNQHFMNYDEQLELAAAQQQLLLPVYDGNTARRGGADEMQMMDEYSSRK